jgi:hypothetical protein
LNDKGKKGATMKRLNPNSSTKALIATRSLTKTSLADKLGNLLAAIPESFFFIALCYLVAFVLSFTGIVSREAKPTANPTFQTVETTQQTLASLQGSFKN